MLLVAVGCHRATPESNFWRWFDAHAAQVATMQRADEPIADELAAALHEVDPRLTFELGVRTRPHELIISADGLRVLFPTVKKLVAAAPSLPGWRIIAFRPRQSIGTIELGSGLRLSSDAVLYDVLPTTRPGQRTDLALYVPGVGGADDAAVKQAVYLLLDAALGEYDVETKIGKIDWHPATARTTTARPLNGLAAVVDGWR